VSCFFTHNVHIKRVNTGIPATHNTNHSKSIQAYELSMGGLAYFFMIVVLHIWCTLQGKSIVCIREGSVHKHEVKFTRSIALFPVSFIKSKFWWRWPMWIRGIGCLGKLKETGQKTAHSTPCSHVYQVSHCGGNGRGIAENISHHLLSNKITEPHKLVHILQH